MTKDRVLTVMVWVIGVGGALAGVLRMVRVLGRLGFFQ